MGGDNPVEAKITTSASFQKKKNNAKIYVPVVTLSINDNVKFLKHLKQGFRRTVSWNRHRSEIRADTKKQQFRLYD